MKKTKDLKISRRTGPRRLGSGLNALAVSLLAVWAAQARAQGATTDGALPAITVSATSDATTEGTGSYAAPSATVAGKTAESLQDVPNSVSVLTRQRMDDQNLNSVEDALRYVTGVQSTRYGDGTSYFKARGNPIGVEFDGLAIVSGLQYLTQFDLDMYDRVEVFRGPAGLIDGAGEPGGIVNLVRKRPGSTFHVVGETQVGTYGSVRQMVDVTGPLNKEGSLRGRAVLVGEDALQSVHGVRAKKVMAYGALDYDLSPRTTVSLSLGYQNNPLSGLDYGVGGTYSYQALKSSFSKNFSPSWNYSYTSLQEANLRLDHRFDNGWTSQTTVFYRHMLAKGDYAYSGPGVSEDGYASYAEQRQRNTYDWFGADTHVSGDVDLFGQRHTLTVGANYSLQSSTALGGYADLPGYYNVFDADSVPHPGVPISYGSNTRIEQFGVYAQGRFHLTRQLALILGGREAFLRQSSQDALTPGADWNTTARLNHKMIPYAGVVYDIVPSLSAYVSYSKIFSPQTATAANGSGIVPRTGEQYEAGLKSTLFDGRLTSTAAVFRLNDDHRAVTDPDNPNYSVAGGKARGQGFEFEVNGEPLPNWNLYAGYTLLNMHYEDDSPNLTDGTDPKHLFKLWTTYRLSQGSLRGLTVGGGMLMQSSTRRDVAQGGYAVFGAQIGYRFNKHLSADITVNNLFDRKYYLRPPGTFYSQFGDRRNAMLTVRAEY